MLVCTLTDQILHADTRHAWKKHSNLRLSWFGRSEWAPRFMQLRFSAVEVPYFSLSILPTYYLHPPCRILAAATSFYRSRPSFPYHIRLRNPLFLRLRPVISEDHTSKDRFIPRAPLISLQIFSLARFFYFDHGPSRWVACEISQLIHDLY